MNYNELVPIPAPGDINTGFSAAQHSTMMQIFGSPGHMTQDCSEVTNAKLRAQIVHVSVGPFSVEGWAPAVESLKRVMAAVHKDHPDLYPLVGTAGMLCCRAVRHSTTHFSNHSWGCAIDITINKHLVAQGAKMIDRGLLVLYPYFRAEEWFWAAGYHSLTDAMHFEISEEAISKLAKAHGW